MKGHQGSEAAASGVVVVVDDDLTVLRGMTRALDGAGLRSRGCGSHAAGRAALEGDDVVVLVTDLQLGDASGLDLVQVALERSIAAIVVTGHPTAESAIGALRLSAVDYLVKPLVARELVAAVERAMTKASALRAVAGAAKRTEEIARALDAMRAVLELPGSYGLAPGEGAAPPSDAASVRLKLTPEDRAALSEREVAVIEQLVQGRVAKDIASELDISPHTVRNHLRSIYQKLGVHSQLELMRRVS